MIETAMNPQVREGIRRAHQERGAAVRNAWLWLTRRGR